MKPTTPSDRPKHPPKPSSSTGSWTTPASTDVLLYEYLWRDEHARGLEAGRKVRPCLVLATFQLRGRLRVITAPLTTRAYKPEVEVPIPAAVKAHLRLDDRARIIWNDLNEFFWVGPDVRTGSDGTPYLGRVPERLWNQVRSKVVAAGIRPVMRSE